MQIDVVNNNNEKVGAIDVRDEVFGGRVNAGENDKRVRQQFMNAFDAAGERAVRHPW